MAAKTGNENGTMREGMSFHQQDPNKVCGIEGESQCLRKKKHGMEEKDRKKEERKKRKRRRKALVERSTKCKLNIRKEEKIDLSYKKKLIWLKMLRNIFLLDKNCFN